MKIFNRKNTVIFLLGKSINYVNIKQEQHCPVLALRKVLTMLICKCDSSLTQKHKVVLTKSQELTTLFLTGGMAGACLFELGRRLRN